jgi:GNAT superfamily N-acetyltransferase
MENWRKFLTENRDDFLKTLGLWIERESNEYLIHLIYFPDVGNPKVIGWLTTMEMGEKGNPCIPDTQEVGTVAVDPKFTKRGLGTYMYEVASFLLKTEKKAGLSSDHSASTTVDAAWVWRKLEKQLNYDKRKTPAGPPEKTNPETGEVTGGYEGENDEFDYNNSTPDPNDDCYEPAEGVAPSDHSLQIPDNRMSRIQDLMGKQMENLDSYIDMGFKFDSNKLQGQGMRLFDRVYDANAPKFQGWDKQ